ncbi:50S ribosomal protein L18 [Desulfoluna spongiiphila]|uniref:Large ribosomal subunit protein uL18 n=1 Tax=Desulfoluna spongiiphila TaxID=419481 RepID=A0A1G5IWF8_9BACT|nr:50S ribosomal protein L18 [Desulfoluna spongiiphila]SCY80051.1 LSU ribosomal protein L18P [Desulfoluna spongiiphila]VVS93320.1 ribosomal protein l18 bacterial-type [Desulfoluna spongiiphila]
MGTTNSRKEKRLKKKIRIRKKIVGTQERPRLCVFRSAKHIYAQLIDDTAGVTLASASTVDKGYSAGEGDKSAKAKTVGKLVAERAMEKGVKSIVFDRSGYIYHGRVKSLAEGAREAGLEF